jgi:hypothetical protein
MCFLILTDFSLVQSCRIFPDTRELKQKIRKKQQWEKIKEI